MIGIHRYEYKGIILTMELKKKRNEYIKSKATMKIDERLYSEIFCELDKCIIISRTG